MTASMEAVGVGLDYPIYSTKAQSLRNAVFNMAIGGRLMKTRQDITVVRALSNVSFRLTEGDRMGIIGHNGAGKSSLLKVLAGIYEPTSGLVHSTGGIVSMLSMSIGLDPEASGLRNIRTLLTMQQLSKKEIERRLPAIVDFSELGAFIHMPFKSYSAGMAARLMFAIGTEVGGEILLMDEWIGAGDANFRDKAIARTARFVNEAKVLVIASHDTGLVRSVCNKVLVLDGGEQTYFGSTEQWFAQSAAA